MMISSNGGSRFSTVALLLGFVIILALVAGCGDGKEIIKYKDRPAVVSLVYPSTNLFVTVNPTFYWNRSADAVRYELQVATASDFVNKTIDIQTADTAYTTQSTIPNSTYYWRVRGQNLDGLWGDWSDAEIRAFFKSDYINYFELISQTETMGTPQDLFLRNDTAYIADGQADLTIVDVSNPLSPFLIRNIDPNDDDFAKGVYVSPNDTFPYAFVADMDGKIQALHVQDTTFLLNQSFGTDQNLEDVTGLIVNDILSGSWRSPPVLTAASFHFTRLSTPPMSIPGAVRTSSRSTCRPTPTGSAPMAIMFMSPAAPPGLGYSISVVSSILC